MYADAVADKGAALSNCFGFVDGTVRPICRPGKDQKVVYNGHKRVHALKFQSVPLPNGLVAHLYGPVGTRQFVIILIVLLRNCQNDNNCGGDVAGYFIE